MQSQEQLISALHNLIVHRSQTLLESDEFFRNLVFDTLAPFAELSDIRLMGDIAISGFVRQLHQQPGHFTTLAETASITLGETYPEELLAEALQAWKQVVSMTSGAHATGDLSSAAESDLVNMVILPKMKTGRLNPDSEREIYDAAEVKGISQQRTAELITEHKERLGVQSVSDSTAPISPAGSSSSQKTMLVVLGSILTAGLIIALAMGAQQNGSKVSASGNDSQPDASMSENAVTEKAVEPTPLPTPVATPDPTESVQSVVRQWQDIKRAAFTSYDTSRISEVMRGRALEETSGGVNWWARTAGAQFHDIQLHSLSFTSTKFPDDSTAKVLVNISETRDTSQNGYRRSKTSAYQAVYTLTHFENGSWYITGVQALD